VATPQLELPPATKHVTYGEVLTRRWVVECQRPVGPRAPTDGGVATASRSRGAARRGEVRDDGAAELREQLRHGDEDQFEDANAGS
jgi:hypothetical protein